MNDAKIDELWPRQRRLTDVTPSLPVISLARRRRLASQIPVRGQHAVMAETGLFDLAVVRPAETAATSDTEGVDQVTVAVFNMERGQTLPETLAFAAASETLQSFDIILANELDDGCQRSFNCDVSATFAAATQMHEAFGLEFIELVNEHDKKGYHGNSLFSRWPFEAVEVVRLPQEYDWYDDAKQHRIGGRLAVMAIVKAPFGRLGVVTTHFENRTDAAGRGRQMVHLLIRMASFFPPDLPLVLGGDFNTNGYDGRDYGAAARTLEEQQSGATLEDFYRREMIFAIAEQHGFAWREAMEPEWPTRRAHFSEEIYADKSEDTLYLHLDWLFSRRLQIKAKGMVSTVLSDIVAAADFAKAAADLRRVLSAGRVQELSDHNIVWATYELQGD